MNDNLVNGSNSSVNVGSQNNGKDYKKFYICSFIIVGIILLIAVVLLIFLLTGTIGSRNRLSCTITTKEDGYDYKIVKNYVFDNDVMQKVYYTYTFSYNGNFTDDMYYQNFEKIINNETHGSSKYGFNTKISKEDNVVTITAYEPSYWKESYKEIKSSNKDEGYSCR